MKKVLSILATTAMAFSFLGANLAQACGCGCKCGCQSAPKQQCPCTTKAEVPSCKCGCPVSKEDFAKILQEKEAALNTELGLSKSQQEKAKAIFVARKSALTPVITELKAKKQALTEIENSSFKLTKIRAKREQKEALEEGISALKEQRKVIFEKYNTDFEAILTDAQKAQWKEIRAKHSLEHHKRHHEHLGCPCGCDKK